MCDIRPLLYFELDLLNTAIILFWSTLFASLNYYSFDLI
jgi:hypothetical protein